MLAYSIHNSLLRRSLSTLFFFNDTATTEIYTLSLHDALPISLPGRLADALLRLRGGRDRGGQPPRHAGPGDRSEEHTSELQSHSDIVCRLLLEKKKRKRPYRKQLQARDAEQPARTKPNLPDLR